MNYPMQDGIAKLLTTEEYFKMYSDLCPYQPFLDTVRNHGINSCKADVFSSFPDYQVVRNEFQKYAGTSLSLQLFYPYRQYLSLLSQLPEKITHHPAAFFSEDSRFNLRLMVEFLPLKDIQDRSCTSRFRIHCPDNDLWYSRLDYSPRAHLARLQSDIHRTFFKPPVSCLFAGFLNR